MSSLPDDVVYGILADDETPRKLWISTNRGLAHFSPETGQFQYYFKIEGFQDNEFNTFAAFKARSGKFFFGGVNGLTVFDPKDLKANTEPPEVPQWAHRGFEHSAQYLSLAPGTYTFRIKAANSSGM